MTALPSAAALAEELYTAERERRTVRPLTERFPDIDADLAYAAQEAYAARRRADGARVVGRKIGATSQAIQRLFGIDTPDFGYLFDDMRVTDGDAVACGDLIAPMVEPEVAFVLAVDLAGPGVTAADVLTATSALHPALEIIDSRIDDWRIAFEDTVADNGSSARFVLGTPVPPDEASALDQERVALLHDAEVVDEALGSAVLGHPAASVAWLANAIGAYGATLHAGDVVLSGSFTSAYRMAPGSAYSARFSTLGAVSCVAT